MQDFFKEEFQFQIARKDRLQQAVAFPVGLALASGTVIKSTLEMFDPINRCDWIAIGPSFLAFVCLIIFVINGARFFVGHEYAFLPLTTDYADFIDGFKEIDGKEGEDELKVALRAAYISGAAHNAKRNEARSSALYWMNLSVAVSLLIGSLGFSILLFSQKF